MNREEYIKHLEDSGVGRYYNLVMSVYDYFEEYFESFVGILPSILERNSQDHSKGDYFKKTWASLKESKMSDYISEYQEPIAYDYFIRPIFSSFSTNVSQYAAMEHRERDDRTNAIKFLKVLCSMYCFSRTMVFFRDLQDIQRRRSDKPVVLAVGTCEKKGLFYVSIKREIDFIWETACSSKQVCVIPELACSFGVFKSLLRQYDYSIIHVAGHGVYTYEEGQGEYCLEFLDERKNIAEFQECLSNHQTFQFVVLNCCYSYQFVYENALNNSTYTIVHQDPVDTRVALDLTEEFYDRAWKRNEGYLFSAAQAIATANSAETQPERYWLLK